MKKALSIFALFVGIACLGSANAFAVPTVNGLLGAGEWDNTGYNYYLSVGDPNEAGIPDSYDIKNVTLLQELEGFGFGDANAANDGIYLLIETYAKPSLADTNVIPPAVTIYLSGDFNGDGISDFIMEHTANAAGTVQTVTVTYNVFGPTGDLVGAGGSFSAGDVLEYFIPSAAFNTPHVPFPTTFIGAIVYDNGNSAPDDEVIGSIAVPEPSTMLLFGGALLGMLGIRSRKK